MTSALATVPPVSVDIVKAFVAKAALKRNGSRIIGLRARPSWAGPSRLEFDGQTVDVVPCVSALAVHEAVSGRDPNAWLVILTDRDDRDLGSLLGRFVWSYLRQPEPWELVCGAFQASRPDAALVAAGRPVAEALLNQAPAGGWPPTSGLVLTLDVALGALAARILGIPAEQLDSIGLLDWSADGAATGRLDELSDGARTAIVDWLKRRTGPEGRLTLAVVQAGHGREAVALALIAGLLANDETNTAEVRGRLGFRYGGSTPTGAQARRWAADARTVIERLRERGLQANVLAAAEHRLDEVGALHAAARSDVLPRGLDGAISRLAATISAALAVQGGTRMSMLGQVENSLAAVTGHLLAGQGSPRRRADISRSAVRLLRWLSSTEPAAARTLPEAITSHLEAGCWVDRACAEIWVGDANEDMAIVCRTLYDLARTRREGSDLNFAQLLARHTLEALSEPDVLHVEDVLRAAVMPLAHKTPVLLLVLDGLSAAVASGLVEAAAGEGLHEWLLPGHKRRSGAITALPSVTEVSRTALISGQLGAGGQAQESAGLKKVCNQVGFESAVVHKGLLERSGAGRLLDPELVATLSLHGPRVVAVVLNAVDDALDRGDPSRISWDLDTVTHLRAVIDASQGRTVILTSDHGHVIERRDGELRTNAIAGPGANRWRPAGAAVGEGEFAFCGPRVGLGDGNVVLPWRETLRYGPMKAGYHGGASAAEVVVPLIVLARTDPGGLDLAPVPSPGWWLAPIAAAAVRAVTVRPVPDTTPVFVDEAEGVLFGLPEAQGIGDQLDLTARLLASDVFVEQQARARRTPLSDDVIAAVVRALLAAGGRLSRTAVAARAGVPELRVNGTVAALQRHLNVEGYSVLGWDADSVTVVLDQALLLEQFGLE